MNLERQCRSHYGKKENLTEGNDQEKLKNIILSLSAEIGINEDELLNYIKVIKEQKDINPNVNLTINSEILTEEEADELLAQLDDKKIQ